MNRIEIHQQTNSENMKKKALPPRAKRMKRAARLQSARSWLPKYPGKNVVAGYRKHFAVDSVCALKELEILGVKIDPTYKEQLLRTAANANEAGRRRKAQRRGKAALNPEFVLDQNEFFAFIAGYTEGGFAYGVTWEEWNSSDAAEFSPDSVNEDATRI